MKQIDRPKMIIYCTLEMKMLMERFALEERMSVSALALRALEMWVLKRKLPDGAKLPPYLAERKSS